MVTTTHKYDGSQYVTTVRFPLSMCVKFYDLPLEQRNATLVVTVAHTVPVDMEQPSILEQLRILDAFTTINNTILLDSKSHDGSTAVYDGVEDVLNFIAVEDATDWCTMSRILYNIVDDGVSNAPEDFGFSLHSVELEIYKG